MTSSEFIHSCTKHLLNTYQVLSIALGSRDIAGNRQKSHPPHAADILVDGSRHILKECIEYQVVASAIEKNKGEDVPCVCINICMCVCARAHCTPGEGSI